VGHPGQFVVVCDGVATPYRVSTLYLPTGLLAGPDAAVRNVRALGGAPREVWSFCEGGAVIDADRRRLLWCGAQPLHPEWLTAAARVLAFAWPGWQVRWAYRGVADLAAAAGAPAAGDEYVDHFAADPLEPPDDPADPIECLVTVRAADGTVSAHPVQHPDQLGLLARGPRLRLALPAALAPSRLPVPAPVTGLHLDVAAQRVSAWGYEHPGALGGRWPGWRVEFRADRFAEHNTVCGLPVVRPPALDWAYATLRAGLTGAAADAVPARIVDYYGGCFVPEGAWQYRPHEVTAALAAIDAAQRAG
jgi:hypothetical protein